MKLIIFFAMIFIKVYVIHGEFVDASSTPGYGPLLGNHLDDFDHEAYIDPPFDVLNQFFRDAFNTFNDCGTSSDFPYEISVKTTVNDSIIVTYTNYTGEVSLVQRYTNNTVEAANLTRDNDWPDNATYKLDGDYYKEDLGGAFKVWSAQRKKWVGIYEF